MRSALTLAAVMLLASTANADSFAEFVHTYGKAYSGAEYRKRAAIFAQNLAIIEKHNANPAHTYTLGINEYADWSNEEFRAMKTGLDRAQFHENHATRYSKATYESKAPADLPTEVDWRTKGVVTAVKNQGGCGSCWAFSSTETIESAVAIATGTLLTLSPQQLVSCSTNPRECGGTGGCDGSTQPIAFNYTMGAGLTTEADYPYQGVTGTCNATKIKPVAGIKGQVDLPTNDYNALLTAVATVQPVSISIAAGSVEWQLYSSGIFSKACGPDIDHAVQVVGYGNSTDGAYWTVRNSWGASWGENGYIRIVRSADGNPTCTKDNHPGDGFGCKGGPATIPVCGECGILSGSSYVTGAFMY